MNSLITIVQMLAFLIGGVAALLSTLLFIRLRWPAPALLFAKLYSTALSRWIAIGGVLAALIGWITATPLLIFLGLYVAAVFSSYVLAVTAPLRGANTFEKAFGMDWEEHISAHLKRKFLARRNTWRLPAVPRPRVQTDIGFAMIPGSTRMLVCDVWQPPEHVATTGLAFIYFHGSAFYFLDKDLGTRPLFHHLAAQGHVIMDVAYRLYPETDVMGMVHDVKRAIAWMKKSSSIYNVDPERIVVGGGSAGGHLALLAAYTNGVRDFTPNELGDLDTSVCAVASFYGSNHMEALYYHTNQHLTTRDIPGKLKKKVPTRIPAWLIKRMGNEYHRLGFDKGLAQAGTLAPLLGGHPDECPDVYAKFSVVTHVHPHCPPTYLIHGEHDIMAPVSSTIALFKKLQETNIPALMHILPQTEHGFDLILPVISPPAHTELYELERFLALHCKTTSVKPDVKTIKAVEPESQL